MFEQMHSQTFWLSVNSQYNNINATIQPVSDLIRSSSYKFIPGIGIVLVLFNILYLLVKKNKYITVMK